MIWLRTSETRWHCYLNTGWSWCLNWWIEFAEAPPVGKLPVVGKRENLCRKCKLRWEAVNGK